MGIILILILAAAALGLIGSGALGGFGNVTGATYSYTDLVSLAMSAGFSAVTAPIAAAVALAESSGDPNAYNPEKAAGTPEGKGSYGLWQIYLKAHPEFEGQNLFDPEVNAKAAFSVYSN